MVRLYVPRARLSGEHLPLSTDERGYLIRVRRLSVGDAVEVFDGEGERVSAVVEAEETSLRLGARCRVQSAQRFDVEIWAGLSKGDKLELVIQKATELGVGRVVPFASERAVVKLDAERGASRLARWRKVAQEAARQSGRSDVPEIAAPAAFGDFLDGGAQRGLLHPRAAQTSLWPWLSRVPAGARVALAVGPEGGFAQEEIAQAQSAGVAILGLGELTLRTETSAIAVAVLAMAAAGGLGSLG